MKINKLLLLITLSIILVGCKKKETVQRPEMEYIEEKTGVYANLDKICELKIIGNEVFIDFIDKKDGNFVTLERLPFVYDSELQTFVTYQQSWNARTEQVINKSKIDEQNLMSYQHFFLWKMEKFESLEEAAIYSFTSDDARKIEGYYIVDFNKLYEELTPKEKKLLEEQYELKDLFWYFTVLSESETGYSSLGFASKTDFSTRINPIANFCSDGSLDRTTMNFEPQVTIFWGSSEQEDEEYFHNEKTISLPLIKIREASYEEDSKFFPGWVKDSFSKFYPERKRTIINNSN